MDGWMSEGHMCVCVGGCGYAWTLGVWMKRGGCSHYCTVTMTTAPYQCANRGVYCYGSLLGKEGGGASHGIARDTTTVVWRGARPIVQGFVIVVVRFGRTVGFM